MRKAPLDALFPKIRQEILATMLVGSKQSWGMSELARAIGVRPSSLQRELASLVAAGILERHQTADRPIYHPHWDCPILNELRGLFLKTTGLVDVVKHGVHKFRKKIDVAFLFGSIARAEEWSGSDVDLMVVGDVGLADLAVAIQRIEQRLGREVNPMIYSRKEFVRRVGSGDHFLQKVLAGPILKIQGDPNELAGASQ